MIIVMLEMSVLDSPGPISASSKSAARRPAGSPHTTPVSQLSAGSSTNIHDNLHDFDFSSAQHLQVSNTLVYYQISAELSWTLLTLFVQGGSGTGWSYSLLWN